MKGRIAVVRKWFVFLMLVAGIFFFAPQAKAGKEEIYLILNLLVEKGTITKQESDEIMAAVENIVKKQKQDAEKNSVKTGSASNMKISGYLQTRYNVYEYKGSYDQFDIKRARASISGKIVDNFDYKLEFDLVKGKNNDLLTDAWVKFTRFPQANLTVGQFKIPYSEEYLISSSALDTIERSLPVNNLATEYDRGIMIDGDMLNKKIYYGVAFVNGTGANASDNNDEKDIVARLVFFPFADFENILSGLKFGAAYQTGTQDTGANKKDRTRNDLMVKYSYKNFKMMAEYLHQDLGNGPSKTKSEGYYVQGSYIFHVLKDNMFEPVLKYEVYDPDTGVKKNDQNIFTAGFNYYIGKLVKISTNYRWRHDDKGGKIASNCNEWFSQIQIKY